MSKEYRLLKELPGLKIGTIFTYDGSGFYDSPLDSYGESNHFIPQCVEQNKEWFELVLAPPPVKEREDWEIIDCMGATGKLHKYEPKLCLGADKTVFPCTIHSVLRKSDNQVFTVGDVVEWNLIEHKGSKPFTIKSFEINDILPQKRMFCNNNNIDICYLKNLTQLPPKEQSKPVTDNSNVACLSLNDVIGEIRRHCDGTYSIDFQDWDLPSKADEIINPLSKLISEKLKQ